jgi:hypothetical protein
VIFSIDGVKVAKAEDVEKAIIGKKGTVEVEFTRAPSTKAEKCKVKLPPWGSVARDN